MKRASDIVLAASGLIILAPVMAVLVVAIWLQDFRNPFYVAPRMRTQHRAFRMVKLRSMVLNAQAIGGTSTAEGDRRITRFGRFVRRFKFDEVPQLWNVLIGDMSLVGPRPQVARDAALYTSEEQHLFDVRPGITDFASIVFADEGHILAGSHNPDLRYNEIIRPWKSRLGLVYVRQRTLWIDFQLLILTVVSAVARPVALRRVRAILQALNADPAVIEVAARKSLPQPYPPPGADLIESRY